MQLQAREKRIVIVGAVVAVLLLAYLVWPRSTPRETSVELVAANKQAGTTGAPVNPTAALPPPSAPATAQPVVPPPAAPASGIPEGLKLTGVAGGGAIFGYADGSQRLVTRGRDVAPGVTLQAIRLREVILAVGTTNYRLGFGGAAIPIQPPGVAPPAPMVAAPALTAPPPPPPAMSTPTVVMPAPRPDANLAR